MTLVDMMKEGILKEHKPGKPEISRLIKAARRRLDDSNAASLHNETRLEQAYQVVLLCSKIAVHASGYRVREKEGQHYESVRTLRFTLKLGSKLINYFQTLRKKRHKGLYEGMINVSKTDLNEAISAAEDLLNKTLHWLEKNHADLL